MKQANTLTLKTGIAKSEFEKLYLTVREKEMRLYPDEIVRSLPEIGKDHLHYKEWLIRKRSYEKLKTYLLNKQKSLQILELGCGNGWLSARLSEIDHSTVFGVDLNSVEIEQAKRVFDHKNVTFYAGDVFENNLFHHQQFDIIILAAAVQYFPDLKEVIKKLLAMLKPGGEIHLLDTHFYSEQTWPIAKAASLNYYRKLGCEVMSTFYHHHRWSDLKEFHFRVMNRNWMDRIGLKIFQSTKNYFPWIVIYKQ